MVCIAKKIELPHVNSRTLCIQEHEYCSPQCIKNMICNLSFSVCASVAAHYELNQVFDKLIISLCKFTTLLNPPEVALYMYIQTRDYDFLTVFQCSISDSGI